MKLLPGWTERVARAADAASAPKSRFLVPKSSSYFAARETFVDTPEAADAMAQFAQEKAFSHCGFDTG